ncbi:MAG: calcineurin-like phosphoesterase family protein [Planctomycetaceae bacterium]
MRPLVLALIVAVLFSMVLALGPGGRLTGQSVEPLVARGVVYHDKNHNQQRDAGEETMEGVRVSNGHDIVTTNADGEYKIPVTNDSIVFVIKPSGWQVPLSKDQLPRFYYIHKPEGSPKSRYPGVEPTGPLPKSIDFPLYPHEEPKQFQALLFGDPQPRDQKEVDWISHDVIEELIGTEASFGVTLGDIAFDNLETFEALNQSIALLGIPWYNVIGNHDINYEAHRREHANETYERVYGPSYYSFDHGPVHFIVVDDIEWQYNQESRKGRYVGGIGDTQMEFIKNDLAGIPEDQMVVLMMHIPLIDVEDRHELYRLIEQRPFCISISGHTHYHEHVWIKKEDGWEGPKPHHHIINVTVCGSWWSGAPDERGIPHTTMADGAPNGYSIISFDGADYRLDYRAAGRGPDHQMQLDAPEVISTELDEPAFLYANVFNGSEKTKVEMRVAGQSTDWIELDHVKEADPTYQRTFDREAAILEVKPNEWRKLSKPRATGHLWKGAIPTGLPPGLHEIEVRATDHWGRIFNDSRSIRVETAGS